MSECILMEANHRGYREEKGILAHRRVYIEIWGPIPDKYVVHHLCLNKACVNPFHLQALSRHEHGLCHTMQNGLTHDMYLCNKALDEYEADRDNDYPEYYSLYANVWEPKRR